MVQPKIKTYIVRKIDNFGGSAKKNIKKNPRIIKTNQSNISN